MPELHTVRGARAGAFKKSDLILAQRKSLHRLAGQSEIADTSEKHLERHLAQATGGG